MSMWPATARCPAPCPAPSFSKCSLQQRQTQCKATARRRLWAALSTRSAADPPGVADLQASLLVATPPPLPFFPDRRCVEDLALPSLAHCHHYINLTNGIEALPRLQALGLPYRFLRLPSTRCEQQQFEALINDLDADLLMRLALGQCCLVYDLGSRNKKRGASRAIWYGLEFVRYALRRLWLGERGPAYLRGYSVANVFEEHVSSFNNATKKKVRYYSRYIEPGGLPHLHLYGVYAATTMDGKQGFYGALLRHCEDFNKDYQHLELTTAKERPAEAAQAASGRQHSALQAPAQRSQQQQQEQQQQAAADTQAALQEQVQQAVAASTSPLLQLAFEERQALLHGSDTHATVEQLLGMRLFLGGVSHRQYHEWAERTGYTIDGKLAPPVEL